MLAQNRGGSGIEKVVRPTIVAHCRRRSLCLQRREAAICTREVPICPHEAWKFFCVCIFSDEEALSCIQTAILGKKRHWLVWRINGRPTTRTRNRCHCRVCVINYQVGSKSGPAKAGPAGPALPPLQNAEQIMKLQCQFKVLVA